MSYELFYWPSIQGRGEFIRLTLEEAGTNYVDVAREPEHGMETMLQLMKGPELKRPPFAPPFLRAGKHVIAQTANILQYLGPRLNLVPEDESSVYWVHQLQLTVEDLVIDTHDTHHPVGAGLYYHEQKAEALRRAKFFKEQRALELLSYFERVLQLNGASNGFMVGDNLSYIDLSMFQVIAGLRYAFPKLMKQLEPELPGLVKLHDHVAQRPNINSYLTSTRRIAFNEDGIFRSYPELED